MDELKKAVIEQAEGVLTEAYKDVISPSAQPIGVVLSLLPRTIRLFFQKWEKWIINGEESLRLTITAVKEKAERIPEEKLCEPEPYVAVPAIQQIAYCWDSKELREMYANLLVSSMNADKKWSVHPGYVDIVKQLTPDEAKILKTSSQNKETYIPIVDVVLDLGPRNGDIEIVRNYSLVGKDVCDNPDNISQYYDNLYRLRLIDIPEDRHLMNDERYDEICNSDYIIKLMKMDVQDGMTVRLRKKYYFITDFGRGFLSCCMDDDYDSSETATLHDV